MLKIKTVLIVITACLISLSSNAQTITGSGQAGYASPQGNIFQDANDEKLTSFGIGYDLDLMLFLENKLAAGVMYSGNAIFGKESEDFGDIGIYGLSLYGVKGHYRLFDNDKTFSPYGNLSMGVTQFASPDVTVGDETIKGGKDYSFGLRPEVGINLGGFLISAAYLVPMGYTIENDNDAFGGFDGTAGTFNISIGYRNNFDLGKL